MASELRCAVMAVSGEFCTPLSGNFLQRATKPQYFAFLAVNWVRHVICAWPYFFEPLQAAPMVTRREEIQEELEKSSDLSRRPPPVAIVATGSTARKIPAARGQLTLDVLIIGCLGTVYFIAAKLGLKLAFVYPSASSVWPGTGIALAAMLLFGSKVWPGIFVGAFLANLTTAGSTATSLGIAVGNTLEGLIGAYLLNRFANGRNVFDRARDILKFVFLVATLSAVVSATLGVTSLFLGNYVRAQDFASVWFTWWLGNTIGSTLLTPLIVLWSINCRVRWYFSRVLEATLFFVSFTAISVLVFGGLIPLSQQNYPLEFLCIPFFLWTAFRFGQRETATTVAVLSAIAIGGTLHGYGPFATRGAAESLLLLQSFLGVTAVMSLVLAAIVAENKRVENQLLHLAVTDPLTGLSNYRKFIDTLEGEINRARRTERHFAIIFMDVDDLKSINDKLGHVAGNQALCRVANALRESCRAIDTMARFGGDEFAVILPEADEDAARGVAQRVADRLMTKQDGPPVSVSVGIAVYPTDGQGTDALVSAADSGLYRAKSRGRADRL
jgi:diguanylate cyclase (GGDEF)-like protein